MRRRWLRWSSFRPCSAERQSATSRSSYSACSLPSPVVIGPTGLAGLLWPHAELAAARAAARFGTIYCTSHASTATVEEIGTATPGPKWMQAFLYKDRGLTDGVRRTRSSGRL